MVPSKVSSSFTIKMHWKLLSNFIASDIFEDLFSNSSLPFDSMPTPYQGSADTDSILEEAHNVLEGKIKNSMPEPPTVSLENFSKEKEANI